MHTPVVFLVFNRPEVTRLVFDEISKARPPVLLIVADGPREHVDEDAGKCSSVREIVSQITWPCEVVRDYSEHNLGCGERVSSGLHWAFEHVDEAIILEDDCLPDPTFFRFCEELLDHYRDDTRVMHINGINYGINQSAIHTYSYSFTRYPQVWGWATWKRSWHFFDGTMFQWPAFVAEDQLKSLAIGDQERQRLAWRWEDVYQGRIDTWDYQWQFAVMSNSGLAISPTANLISNIGFGEEATHTTNTNHPGARLNREPMDFPLRHPPLVLSDHRVDEIYRSRMLRMRFRDRMRRHIKGLVGHLRSTGDRTMAR